MATNGHVPVPSSESNGTATNGHGFLTARPGIAKALASKTFIEDLKAIEKKSANSRCETVTFYNHSTSKEPKKAKWSEFEDLLAEEKRIKELGRGYAVIQRHSKVVNKEDGVESWVLHSIEAQSPRVRKLLDVVFASYPSWYPDATPYAVAPPFKPYVHRWDDIQELRNKVDAETAAELKLLCDELENPIAKHLYALERVRKTGTVSFENLWLILAPGSPIVSQRDGSLCVSNLLKSHLVPRTETCPGYWVLRLAHVDWNGSFCGLGTETVAIMEYPEPKLVTNLDVYPLEFAPDRAAIEQKLLARGRKFESLRGFHVKKCTGKKYVKQYNPETGKHEMIPKPVSGRIIIDAHAYYKVQNQVPTALVRLGNSEHIPARVAAEALKIPSTNRGDYSDDEDIYEDDDNVIDIIDGSKSKVDKEKEGRNEDLSPLSEFQCILAVPRVRGFDLDAKDWCEFNVDEVEEVDWSEKPYKNLVLPEGEKELIMAFGDRPRLNTQGFDDFIAHKGEGIIILLCGPPGVGKTLTAEAVAEKSRVALYVLSASDLGTEPSKVESGLMQALECCRLWDAVLLLDEADVFLESRDSNSLARNELVSIFLRRLEYYRGLMFLTTNRLNAIDAAFRSRLDLILPYSDLDQPSRRKVWVNFIKKLGPGLAEISESDFDLLSETQLNGREIKNSIKTALVLASRDKPLRIKHLNTVLGIRKRIAKLE